jgi:hypothetical protein
MYEMTGDERHSILRKRYEEVGSKTWRGTDFSQADLNVSRNLFTSVSLKLRKPKPKQLEVYALLSGIPFRAEFSSKLIAVQQRISDILTDSLHYWVLPENLGVEYCVFKWPQEKWVESNSRVVNEELTTVRNKPFTLTIRGIQINPDGTVLARGYDEGGALFNIREQFMNNLDFIPKKQSGWAHVPMGRILEPIGSSKFKELSRLIKELSDLYITSEVIVSVKYVHETRWYMEEKSVLTEVILK